MAGQMFYGLLARGYAGQRYGSTGHKSRSFVNDKGTAKMVSDLVVGTVADSTTYAFTINGYAISYTSGVGATAASVRDGIIDQIRQTSAVEPICTANPSGNDVRITAAVAGTAFVLAESDANLSISVVTANSALEVVPFGRAVVKRTGGDSTDASATMPSGASQIFLGFVERVQSNVSGVDAQAEVTPMSDMSVLHRGAIYVEVEEAIAYGDPVYFRHTASGANTSLGKCRNDADSATCDLIAAAKFVSSTDGAGIAVVEINLP